MIKIGVVGAGVMGKGVSQRFATNGYHVVLHDIDKDVLSHVKEDIKSSLRHEKMIRSLNEDLDAILDRIQITSDYGDLQTCSFIIENIPEVISLKASVYEELIKVMDKETIYLANTSCIPITRIGSFTKDPENVIGVHFMNPVWLKDFVEIIKGAKTSKNTIDKVLSLLQSVSMYGEVINDSPGFVSNRVSHLFMNEAAFLVLEGVASPTQVDQIFKQGFGHKMGPLETADLIGLDTVLESLKILYEEYQDPKFRACPLLQKKVDAGALGRKTKEGFYKY